MKFPAFYPVPRKRRPGGYRSKDPARNEHDQVGSYTYDRSDLRRAVVDGELEQRGNGATGAPKAVESLGLLFGRGWRIVPAR